MNCTNTLNVPAMDVTTIASATVCLSRERFDDATNEHSSRRCNGTAIIGDTVFRVRNYDDLACCGFNYSITMGGTEFKVRSYDDMPGRFTVISHTLAIGPSLARQLVDYLLSEFGCWDVCFYDAATDSYREIDLQALAFQIFRF